MKVLSFNLIFKFIKPSFFSFHNEPKDEDTLLSDCWLIVNIVALTMYLNFEDFEESLDKISLISWSIDSGVEFLSLITD